jgi:LacI family transcriptional regulator
MMVVQGIQSMLKRCGYHLLLSNNTMEEIVDEKG